MCKYLKTNLKPILKLAILLLSLNIYGQTIDKPTLGFSSACGSDGFNNFNFSFVFRDGLFDTANTFEVVLSDADGNFSSSSPVIFNVTDSNINTFPTNPVNGSFSVPDGSFGTGYRIKVIASNPNVESPPSDPFEMYRISSEPLILNDFNTDLVLCNGVSETVSLSLNDPNVEFIWYRDNNPLSSETSSSLTISQPGEYYAEINYGGCPDAVVSNKIFARVVNSSSLSIQGSNTVELCADESYDLVASIDDPSFTYKWFKDGVEISGLPAYLPTYTTPTSDQFGVYHLEIEVSGCSSRSQDVTLQQKSDVEISVTIEPGPSPKVILPGEDLLVTAVHDASGTVSYTWFRDGNEIMGVFGETINASTPGVYSVVVTESSGTCPVSGTSEDYVVLAVNSIKPEIRTDTDYTECESSSVTLSIVGVKGIATDGNEYDLSQDQINLLLTQWYKDGNPISGATDPELVINSFNDNGSYYLNVFRGSLSGDSDPLDILLTQDLEIVSSSASNTLCPGESITLSLSAPMEPGFTYRWFKDDVEISVTDPSSIEVTEIGVYYVTYEGFGCQVNTAQVEVIEFDDTILEVSPSTNAVLTPGETLTLTASGADSYEWYDEAGNLLSTNETLDVTALGTYTVIASVGSCTTQRDINVVEDDGKLVIPNIITPFNGDGINDTWELPNRFAFQTNVQVIIFNSKGEEVLNTNDYQNNWPENNNLKDGMLFYFKVIRENNLIKAGTISILQ